VNILDFIRSLEAAKVSPEKIVLALKEHELLKKEATRQRVKKHRENNKPVTKSVLHENSTIKNDLSLNINETVTKAVLHDGDGEKPLNNNDAVTESALQPSISITYLSKKEESKKEESKKESKITATRFFLTTCPPEWILHCKQKRPDLEPLETFDAFRDWWIAQPGSKGLKLDWFATWRTWVRNQKTNSQSRYAKPIPQAPKRAGVTVL
jgi:hypothetical protein